MGYLINEQMTISKIHLVFIYGICFWTLIYILLFIDQPSWLLTNDSFISTFNAGSGTPINTGSGSLTNTLLTTEGKLQILGWSFLFAFVAAILVYFLL